MTKPITAADIKVALSRKYKDGWLFLTEITQPRRFHLEAWIHDFDETIESYEWLQVGRDENHRPKARKLDVLIVALWASREASAIGFEIKVSRNDFVNERYKSKKYEAWLPYCDKFYFVCTEGIAVAEEIPNDCGLAIIKRWGRGYRILYAKPAPRRKIQRPPWRLVARIIHKLNAENWKLKRKILQLEDYPD